MQTLHAPAKINLTLEVLARRDDGYHTLRSLMAPIALYDRISFEPALASSFAAWERRLEEDNLVVRALAAAGISAPMRVELHKEIPIGGGLGGGSSDAAAVLRAAMDGAFGPLAERDWIAAARSLGSDVPFFLAGTAAIVEGTGERVTAVGALPAWWLVVVRPPVEVATAEAYQRLDALRAAVRSPRRARSTSATLRATDALQRADYRGLLAVLGNDFHDPILAAHPAIARAHAELLAAGAPFALLSGSGSCLFSLFESEPAARACGALFDAAAAQSVFVCAFHRDPAWR